MRTTLTRRTWMSSAAAVLGTAALRWRGITEQSLAAKLYPLVSTLRNYHTTRNLA